MYEPLQVTLLYSNLFPARNDVYSHWTKDGWRPIREPMTPEIVLAGLTGNGPSISGFMIAPGNTSHSVAVDFDGESGFVDSLLLGRTMVEAGVPAYVEKSRRGAHLWCILDKPCPAVAIRMALRGLLQSAGLPPVDPKIELRPGTDTISEGGLGHALRLPLMPHPTTGFRGKMLDPLSGAPIGNTAAEVILAVDYASSATFLAWAEKYQRPPAVVDHEHRNPREHPPDDGASAAELLRSLWGAHDAVPGKVIACPAKSFHSHGDIHKGCRVFPDDKRVMCHKPGCILNNDGRGRGTYEIRKLAPHAL